MNELEQGGERINPLTYLSENHPDAVYRVETSSGASAYGDFQEVKSFLDRQDIWPRAVAHEEIVEDEEGPGFYLDARSEKLERDNGLSSNGDAGEVGRLAIFGAETSQSKAASPPAPADD
jgi:hypothetical protein